MRFAVWALTPKGVFEAERPLSTRGDGGYEGNDVHIRIERVGEVQLLDELTSTEWEERSALELEIGYVVTDNAAVGTFAAPSGEFIDFSKRFGRDSLLSAEFRITAMAGTIEGSGFMGYDAGPPAIGSIDDGEFERNGTDYTLSRIGQRQVATGEVLEIQITIPAPPGEGDVRLAVGGSDGQSSFTAGDFTDGTRSVVETSGEMITIPTIPGAFFRRIAIAVRSDRDLTSVTGHGFLGNLVDDMKKQSGTITIRDDAYSVWVSDNDLAFGQHGIGGEVISVETAMSGSIAISAVAKVETDFARLFFHIGDYNFDPADAAVSVSGREYRWTWSVADGVDILPAGPHDVEVLNAAGEDHAFEFRVPVD